jgi:hypothetical protein
MIVRGKDSRIAGARRRTTATALVLLASAVAALTACGAGRTAGLPATTDTAAPATTVPVPSSTTVAPQASTAVWPPPGAPYHYATPQAAAQAFATGYVGFVDPIIGPFREGDARSGEVDVRPTASGPATVVLVRQLSADGSWSVLGATTANIHLDQPGWFAAVSSPVTLQGSSTAFEGTVQAEIRQDGSTEPLGRGFVTGGRSFAPQPFSASLTFSSPAASAGALLLSTVSTENGHVWEAAVLRVRFPRLSITPGSGPIGTVVSVSGTGCQHLAIASVHDNGRELQGAQPGYPDPTGAWSVTLRFYEGLDPDHRFTIQAACYSAPGVKQFEYPPTLFTLERPA